MVQGASLKKKKHLIDQGDVKLLATSWLHFEQARASVSILSAYETQKSKVKLLLQDKKILVSEVDGISGSCHGLCPPKLTTHLKLTGKDFVSTGANQKQLFEMHTDHWGLCHLDIQNPESKVMSFLTTVLEDARLRIVRASPECWYSNPCLRKY